MGVTPSRERRLPRPLASGESQLVIRSLAKHYGDCAILLVARMPAGVSGQQRRWFEFSLPWRERVGVRGLLEKEQRTDEFRS